MTITRTTHPHIYRACELILVEGRADVPAELELPYYGNPVDLELANAELGQLDGSIEDFAYGNVNPETPALVLLNEIIERWCRDE